MEFPRLIAGCGLQIRCSRPLISNDSDEQLANHLRANTAQAWHLLLWGQFAA
jgi:hypothetical protein